VVSAAAAPLPTDKLAGTAGVAVASKPSRWLMLRYGALIFVPLLLVLAARTVMLYHAARDQLEQATLQSQQTVLLRVTGEIKQSLGWSVRDVLFLASIGKTQAGIFDCQLKRITVPVMSPFRP
jgi:hypothetical protein